MIQMPKRKVQLLVLLAVFIYIADARRDLSKRSAEKRGFPFLPFWFGAPVETDLCCSGEIIKKAPRTQDCCAGNFLYNITVGECCNQKYVEYPDKSKRRNYRCCDEMLYDMAKQLCTEKEKVKENPFGRDGRICGEEVINATETICCEGTALPRTGNAKNTACCGKTAFDMMTQACSKDDKVYENPNKIKDAAICGDKLIDWKTSACCKDNTVVKAGPTEWCCGTTVFDTNDKVCCRDELRPRNESRCCGKTFFNIETQLCVNEKIVDIPTRLENETYFLYCGGQLYGRKLEHKVCCNNMAFDYKDGERCCGAKTYTLKTQTCCNATVYEGKVSCCGDRSYNETTEVCCGAKIKDRAGELKTCYENCLSNEVVHIDVTYYFVEKKK